MTQKLRRAGVLFTATLFLSSVFSPFASAVHEGNPNGAFDLVVSPPSVGLAVEAGKSITTEINVQNQGIATEHVKVSVMKFGAHGQDGTPSIQELEPNDEFAKWVKFSAIRFDAETNIWKPIKMTISPPPKAAFGYYYAVVFSREGAEQNIKQRQANLLGAVASLVLLDVKAPGAVRKTSIVEFSTPNKVQEFLPLAFTVRMRNTGNVHVAPRGNIIISKGGETVGLLEVNLKKGYILPNTYRKFTATWADGTPVYKEKVSGEKTVLDENGKPVQYLDWDKFSSSKLRYGKYDAKLVMVYDDGRGDVATEARLSFWVMPWRIIAVIGAVMLFVLAGLYALVIRPIRSRTGKSRGYAGRR